MGNFADYKFAPAVNYALELLACEHTTHTDSHRITGMQSCDGFDKADRHIDTQTHRHRDRQTASQTHTHTHLISARSFRVALLIY